MLEEEKVDKRTEEFRNIYPTSIKSKVAIKIKLRQILNEMDKEYPLSNFGEDIEYETKGKFIFLELKQIIDKKYPELNIEKKLFLLKYIPLTSIGVSQKTPYITLLNLFAFFEKIIEKKIISSSFIFYKAVQTLKNKLRITPSELFYSIGLYTSSLINLKEFYIKIATKLNLDDIESLLIFKGLDYKNCGKIKISDFILVLNSFYNENNEALNNFSENKMKEEEKSAQIIKMFFDKNSINIDYFFEGGKANYMEYSEIKKSILKEISNNQNNFEKKEPISEKIVDDVLTPISRNYKIFKDDFENFLNNSKSERIHGFIKLNDIQKYWIAQYIKTIESINITPKMAFEASIQTKSLNIINLEDLKRQLHILLPGGKISIQELNNMMDALNVNNNKILTKLQYYQIIKQVMKEKEKEFENDNKQKNDGLNNKKNNELKENWHIGIKSPFYHALPVKGNYGILISLNRDINQNYLISNEIIGEKEEDSKIDFMEEEKLKGDEVSPENFEEKKLERKNELNIKEEYIDRHTLIELLENFGFYKLILPSYIFFKYLINNNISKEKSFEIMKYIDKDKDGYISIIQILNFLLKELAYRSMKLLYKYLYLKIYQDLGFPSSEEFFTRYNFSIYDSININDLSKLYLALNIELPLVMKSYEEIRNIFKSPYIYKNICKLIDVYKTDEKINNFDISYEKKEEENYSIPINKFDLEIKNFIYKLFDKKDIKKDNYKRAIHIHQKLKPILKNCTEKMNLSQYNLFFAKPLNIEPSLAMTLFQLLKTIMPDGEQLLDKNDLIMLLESYSSLNDNSLIENDSSKDRIEQLKQLVEHIENNYPPMKYAFEAIPFRRTGLISSTELIIYLQSYYRNIPKNDLMKIIKHLDNNKIGYINYSQIQMFLYDFSIIYKYSLNIELKIISSNISKKGILNADEYFMKDEFKDLIKKYEKIGKREHNILFDELCSSNKNQKELYEYLINLSSSKKYDLKLVSDIINGFLELDYEDPRKMKREKKIKEENILEERPPKKEVFEEVLQNINLGNNGYVLMNQLLRQIPEKNQKTIRNKFDRNRIGYLPFPEFIKICRDIYGTNINLNYKLCAQYLYKKFIKSPELIQSYLLKKINETNILVYLSYEVLYNNFMFAFVNDKYLFEDFYNSYKEKKGEHQNLVKLHSLQLFILYNNPELSSFPKIDFIKINKEEINSQDFDVINNLIKKKLISIREIIDMININECDLKKDFSINEKYIRILLNKSFDYIDEDIDVFCNYFRSDLNRFNLQKFFCFDKIIKNSLNVIIIEEIIPKITEQITKSGINNYRQYKLKNFKSDLLTINEVFNIFNNLYNLTLFHCLCIINDEQYLSIEKFFEEYELKELFMEKEYEPILKTAIMKLNDYFEEHKDKLKLFKEIDLDKNGLLSKEEFITLLNSLEGLNLEDNQKYKLLKVADKNKDGKINPKEFLSFIKTSKYLSDSTSITQMNSTFPVINKSIAINNTSFTKRYLEDKSLIEKNLEINKSLYKGRNGFLNTIIILQEDILENFFNFDCMEQDFKIADIENNGRVTYFKFNSILKKRLFQLKDSNFIRMIKFADEGLEPNLINELNGNKVIDYKNFLKNLVHYNEQGKNKKEWEEDEIIIEQNNNMDEKKEGKESEKAEKEKEINTEEKHSEEKDKKKEIQLGGLVEEQHIEKKVENEYDNFLNNGLLNNEENKNETNKLNENEIMEEKEKIEAQKINDIENEENQYELNKDEEGKQSEETKGLINEEHEENESIDIKLSNNKAEEIKIEQDL